jgi:hypothetical protein
VDGREVTAMIESLISKLNARGLQERAAVLLNTVIRAVDRSLGCVEELLSLEDAREAGDLHTELSARRQQLWSAMNEPTYVYRQ